MNSLSTARCLTGATDTPHRMFPPLRGVRRDTEILRRFLVNSMAHLGLPIRAPDAQWLAALAELRWSGEEDINPADDLP